MLNKKTILQIFILVLVVGAGTLWYADRWIEELIKGNNNQGTEEIKYSKKTTIKEPINTEEQKEQQKINSDWTISLSEEEMTSDEYLEKNTLLYATKEAYKVVIYQKNILSGDQKKVFEYNENKKAERSGNLWEGLPPSIALSPNGNILVFIDQEGLKTYDLQTANITTFIRKDEEADPKTEIPPKWSIKGLSAYTLARPKWSKDGRYISFLQSHWEGSSFGVVDFLSGEYIPLDLYGGYRNLIWGPNGHSLVKTSTGAYEGIGLFFASSNIEEIENLSEKFEKKESSFFDANFSPNGKKIVFTYSEDWQSKDIKIGVVNTDGSEFLFIDKGDIQLPLFSNNGNSVLFVKKVDGKQCLFNYDMTKAESSIIAILPESFNRWDEASWIGDRFLVVIGTSSSSSLVVGGDSTRLVILDINSKKVIYASPIYNQFVSFAGFKK